jgi:hypothetical protein
MGNNLFYPQWRMRLKTQAATDLIRLGGRPAETQLVRIRLLSGRDAVHDRACHAETASAPASKKFELRIG